MAERVYAGLSADQRSARRREQLIAAGLEVFAQQGWDGSTVQDVCRAAGVSPRYFYELFDDREALFVAVTQDIAQQVQDVVSLALLGADEHPQQRARAVLGALAHLFSDDPRLVRVALMESLATEELRAHRRALLEEFAALAARFMRPLRAMPVRGVRAQRAMQLSATLLTGGMVEALIARQSDPGGDSTELLVDHLTDLFVAAARL
jgi:AcrR family transcriptional regulator